MSSTDLNHLISSSQFTHHPLRNPELSKMSMSQFFSQLKEMNRNAAPPIHSTASNLASSHSSKTAFQNFGFNHGSSSLQSASAPKPQVVLPELDIWCAQARDSHEHSSRLRAVQKIRNCYESSGSELDLSNLNLSSLPESIGNLQHVAIIRLNGNLLTKLPESFKSLQKLEILYLNNNNFTEIPLFLKDLKTTQTIFLSNNNITDIPSETLNKHNRCHFILFNCPLKTVDGVVASRSLLLPLIGLNTSVSLFQGNQDGRDGPVNLDVASEICGSLNNTAVKGVVFEEDRLVSELSGGTCTAMTLNFADQYSQARQKGLPPEEAFEEIQSNYHTSGESFRTLQAALNTIAKDEKSPSSDFKEAKIDSMVRLFDFQVLNASEEFDLYNENSLEKLETIMQGLSDGLYVIRCLREGDNHKEEVLGHTTLLIIDEGEVYFYDPNDGLKHLDQTGYESLALHQSLQKSAQKWDIPCGRIYKIQDFSN